MAKRCKYCRRDLPDGVTDFCGPDCEDAFFERHEERVCSKCGKKFVAQMDAWGTVCARCAYKANYKAPTKKKSEPKKHKIYGSIDDILTEQRRIYEETGRWLSYGEIMAKKVGATWTTENGSLI